MISLLLGTYNSFELNEISRENAELTRNQKHIVKAINGLEKVIEKVEDHMEVITNELNRITEQVSMQLVELHLQSLVALIASKAKEMGTYISNMQIAIFDLSAFSS